jgi:hypothetical protein
MRSARIVAAALVAALIGGGAVLVAPLPAAADGVTKVAATCTGIPILGTLQSSVNVDAVDNVDPVAPGGNVTDTVTVPIPVGDVPIAVTIKEVKITLPIPSGVTVNNVTFTSSSFTGQSYAVSGSSLIITLTGSVAIGNGAPPPTVPTLKIFTTVAGPERTVSWKVPTTITAKASAAFPVGNFTATCTPDVPSTVLITTVVALPNDPPVATDQSLTTPHATPKAITLAGTDPDLNPLTFAVKTQPGHGTVTGTPPNVTYTPANNFSGADSFTFTASDGKLLDTGTISINVTPVVPGVPTINGIPAIAPGQATVSWSPPLTNGGSAITNYVVTPYVGDVAGTPVEFAGNATSGAVTGLTNGTAYTFTVAAKNAVGTGTASPKSTEVTPTEAAVVPSAPTIGTPVASEGQVLVPWTAPVSDGGSTILSYLVTPSKAGVPQTPVSFLPGATSGVVTGLTNGSAYTFNVKAINGVGPSLPSASSAAVTPQWWLPWSTGTKAVDEVFLWLSGKAPTAAQRSTWLAKLNGGTSKLADLVVALRGGPDATGNVDPVARLYSAYFLRIPDKGGLTYWITKRRGGAKLETISSTFAGSNEFKTKYGQLTNAAFVNLVYQNVLGRAGDPGGVSYWTNQLNLGKKSRGQVMVGFSESSEFTRKQKGNIEAAVLYIQLLGRAPSLAERTLFVTGLTNATPLATMVRGLLHAPEVDTRAG